MPPGGEVFHPPAIFNYKNSNPPGGGGGESSRKVEDGGDSLHMKEKVRVAPVPTFRELSWGPPPPVKAAGPGGPEEILGGYGHKDGWLDGSLCFLLSCERTVLANRHVTSARDLPAFTYRRGGTLGLRGGRCRKRPGSQETHRKKIDCPGVSPFRLSYPWVPGFLGLSVPSGLMAGHHSILGSNAYFLFLVSKRLSPGWEWWGDRSPRNRR